ncbi:MAG: hypothetical protein FJW90_01670 [Actinobacteria bacterium]|nr:hypothetical protein [Actinomycetota bacterium]
MRSSRLIAPLLLLAAAPFLLAACGDDSSGDEDGITAAIEQAATTDTAENCTEVQTDAFNQQTEFASEGDATEVCEQEAGQGDVAADSVEVESIEVDGESATADVSFSGGNLDGQVLAISLVDEDGQWKLDSLDEFVEFDKEAFATGLLEKASSDGETPQGVLNCLEQAINAASDDELTGVYLSGDESQLVALFGECFGQ